VPSALRRVSSVAPWLVQTQLALGLEDLFLLLEVAVLNAQGAQP
jgi:hypothetical protein